MKKLILVLFSLVLLFTSCSSSRVSGEKITIASEQADCVGVAPMRCLLIKEAGQQGWSFFYNGIEGFNYEPGYEYEILVKKENVANPAADQSSLKYTLVKELSRVKKTSENLPQR